MEVGPRDGLQSESIILDTKDKISFISELSSSGLSRIEITAFVSKKWIPGLYDSLEVANGIRRINGVSYAALVPNMNGYIKAKNVNIDEISLALSVSNSHNKKNINLTTKEAIIRYKEVAFQARKDKIPFRCYVSCAFGCPYEGETSIRSLIEIIKIFLDLGAYEVSIADTIGIANPLQIYNTLIAVSEVASLSKISLHMHDTRGLALANILVAINLGVSSFDSSSGGLGGCPYAPGSSGNVATEDLVYMLHSMGIKTGVNLNSLCNVSRKIQKLLKKKLPSKVLASFC